MALLLDIFGFISVMLRGIVLSTQTLVIGGVVFLGFVVAPVAEKLGAVGEAATARGRRLLFWSALILAGAELLFIVLECVVLAGTMDIPLRLAFGAGFARFGLMAAAAAAAITFVARGALTRGRILALFVLSMVALAAQLATSHAAAQVDSRAVLLVADFLHMAAAGAWIGGIPYFLLLLYRSDDGRAHGAHVPAKWTPVRRQEHAQTKESKDKAPARRGLLRLRRARESSVIVALEGGAQQADLALERVAGRRLLGHRRMDGGVEPPHRVVQLLGALDQRR